MAPRYIGGTAAARLIGIARSTVYVFHGKKLHPKKNEAGIWVYDRQEVIAFAQWYQKNRPRFGHALINDGEKAARAFQLFEAGFTVAQVVMSVRMPPDVIEKWYASWLRDAKNLPAQIENELEVSKTTLEIKKEELATKRAIRKEVVKRAVRREEREQERERARRERENPVPELPKRENTPLHEVFEHAAGVKK